MTNRRRITIWAVLIISMQSVIAIQLATRPGPALPPHFEDCIDHEDFKIFNASKTDNAAERWNGRPDGIQLRQLSLWAPLVRNKEDCREICRRVYVNQRTDIEAADPTARYKQITLLLYRNRDDPKPLLRAVGPHGGKPARILPPLPIYHWLF
jgi:hypothetical protein